MTAEEIKGLNLSFYTLSKWSDVVALVYPWSIAALWKDGFMQEFKGLLTLDDLGNFVKFE